MIQATTCPTDLTLQQYAEGWSDFDSNSAVEQHLNQCPACEERLNKIETARASDGLIEALRLRGQWISGQVPNSICHSESNSDSVDSGFRQVLAEIQEWPLDAPRPETPLVDLPRSLGQYELLELIGQGGMAQVYRARHSKLQRTVAIKLLNVPKWQVDRSVARLEREIAVVGQLHHPAIVAATDAGQHEDTPYLVTEFIDGLNLSQLAQRSGSLRDLTKDRGAIRDTATDRGAIRNTSDRGAIRDNHTANVCETIRVAALGLAHAHSQGVTHRDIKPSNLMIDRQGQVKILDFGLVHLEGWQDEALELTTVGQLLGTLDYMAPEQADKATAVDHRSDVYALGATLFRLLCGRAPYAASLYQSPLEKLRLLAMTDPPKVETLRPDLPSELAELINQTLSRDPAKRPPSAAHLAEALSPYCAGHELAAWVKWALDNPLTPRASEPRGSTSLYRRLEATATQQPEPVTSPSRGGRHGWPWLLTAAAGAAALWLSIVLILDTQKGQLVIESESADVRVTLRKDGRDSETLQLEPGLNQTRVFAGTYQIEIDGPADAYQLDRDTIIVKRGEVVLAKVSRKPAVDLPAASQNDSSSHSTQLRTQLADTALFRGQTYRQWVSVIKNERDTKLRQDAFTALLNFSDDELVAETKRLMIDETIIALRDREIGRLGFWLQARDFLSLNDDDWSRLEQALTGASPSDQAWYLSRLAQRWSHSNLDQAGNQEWIRFMSLFENVAKTAVGQWTSAEKQPLATALLANSRIRQWESNEEMLVAVPNCLASLRLSGSDWVQCAIGFPIEESSRVLRLAVDALFDDLPAVGMPTQEHFTFLLVWQGFLVRMSQEQRGETMEKLLPWVEQFNRDHWLTQWSDEVSVVNSWSRRNLGREGRMIAAMLGDNNNGVSAMGTTQNSSRGSLNASEDEPSLRWRHLPFAVTLPDGSVKSVEVEAAPVFGMMLANTVRLLTQNSAHDRATVILNRMLAETVSDHDFVTEQLLPLVTDKSIRGYSLTDTGLRIRRVRIGTRLPFEQQETFTAINAEQTKAATIHSFIRQTQTSLQ
ncbi:MAG: protein kinase [Planctomycetaceae bacterium]|nr:protein kinase [Planctomycetaceae bacterium]